jgi:hypothetical protein
MSGIRDLLIRGSKKVIGHYRLLLASAKNEEERELYRSRIARSSGSWTSFMATSRTGSRRELSDRRRPLRGVRHRAEAARTWQMEKVSNAGRRSEFHSLSQVSLVDQSALPRRVRWVRAARAVRHE